MLDLDKTFRDALDPSRLTPEQERLKRTEDVSSLVESIIGRHAEFFVDPDNRLAFIKDQSAKSFFMLSRYANAKLRGEKPHELRHQGSERRGGSLPMLHTPRSSDKLPAFKRGFDAVQEYLGNTDDSRDEQLKGVAVAIEALIVWVHPFTDGNGRTSRFIGKLVEDGAADIDNLVDETVHSETRHSAYGRPKVVSRESLLEEADDDEEDIMLEDDEREELRKKAVGLPNDPEAMYLSVKRLVENNSARQDIQ